MTECKCYIEEYSDTHPVIVKCPLCKAAPELLEACLCALGSLEVFDKTEHTWIPEIQASIQKAVAKAKGDQ